VADPVLVRAITGAAQPLEHGPAGYDAVLDSMAGADVVLLGEASHGTHEFYQARAEITKRLIVEHKFSAVAVEADWPDAYRVSRYVRGESNDRDAEEALGGFKRFPTWMWRNRDVATFVEWLRARNLPLAFADRVGFYGLDLYSLFGSIAAVLSYLDGVDTAAAQRARDRYACFDHFSQDAQAYGYAAASGRAESCEDEVVAQLVDLRKSGGRIQSRDAQAADEHFFAEQNARLVQNAEAYYRSMFRGRVASWNLRDRHMAETLDALIAHQLRQAGSARIVVWAHNSHLGDARATEMRQQDELNVGQLVRERYGARARLIGFTTHEGEVTAASHWDGPAETTAVLPSLPGSVERALHETGVPRFFLDLRQHRARLEGLGEPRLERAIGVIYRPDTERLSHYFHAQVLDQFDALLHFDRTTAVEPIELRTWEREVEPAETYPSGL